MTWLSFFHFARRLDNPWKALGPIGTRRANRIRELNGDVAELANERGILVRSYSRAQIIEYFEELGTVTKHGIAETIAKHIPALSLYLPPARKPWMSEDARMGIFDAAAMAWLFFQTIDKPIVGRVAGSCKTHKAPPKN